MCVRRGVLSSCSRTVSAHTPISLRSAAHAEQRETCERSADPGAIERTSRACKANDVRIDVSADVAQSVRSARAQCIVGHNSRAHASKKKKKTENVRNRVRRLPPGTTVRKQGDGTPLRRAYTSTPEGLTPFGVPPRKLRLEP